MATQSCLTKGLTQYVAKIFKKNAFQWVTIVKYDPHMQGLTNHKGSYIKHPTAGNCSLPGHPRVQLAYSHRQKANTPEFQAQEEK